MYLVEHLVVSMTGYSKCRIHMQKNIHIFIYEKLKLPSHHVNIEIDVVGSNYSLNNKYICEWAAYIFGNELQTNTH